MASGGARAWIVLAAALLAGAPAAAGPAVNVIPAPLSVSPAPDSAPVAIAEGETIFTPRGDAGAWRTAEQLAALALRTRGLNLKVAAGDPPSAGGPAIVLQRRPGLPDEGYALDVAAGQARIAATGDAGLYYGAVTLWQLLTADGRRGAATLAPVRIEDRPQFAWRGLMVDAARHFQSTAEIEQIIDWMSLHKLNVLHWHLVDDQGWRLQIRKYPRLTEVGAWRIPPPGSPDAVRGRKGPVPYGGFYTQDQVREVVAYATARHVSIVPEIEMPGHAVSALLAYPRLGAGAPPPREAQTQWGGFPYIYSGSDESVAFLEDVLTEVMALFPGRYIHVGGDEVAHERWNGTPDAQARLRALGQTDPAALQADLTRRIAGFLEAHGRRLVGWDEILGGALPADATVMSWHGIDGAVAAAAKGHDAVLAPAPWLYFDNGQSNDPHDPLGRGVMITLRDVYSFNPLPANLPPDAAGRLLGLQGNVWTEHIRTFDQFQAMAFPRAAAVAEVAWSAPERRDWTDFMRRLPAQFGRYAALGLKANPAALNVVIDASPDAAGASVSLTAQSAVGEIRYTTDGAEPTPAARRYDGIFNAALPVRVRAAAFLDGVRLGSVAEAQLDAATIRRRGSHQLRLCNQKLTLNLEGPRGPAGETRTYMVNPQDACWLYPNADLTGVSRVSLTFARLPFNFGFDAGHNSVVLHPPRGPAGELEVRQDNCLSDPIAVASLPPGPVGGRATLSLPLPARSGRHDLCFTFTSRGFDPVLALDWVQLAPPGTADVTASHGR